MGVKSSHYVRSNWPSNEGCYNWDAELTCSWNAGLTSAFSHWDVAGRRPWALLNAGFEPRILALLWCWDAGVELCWDAGVEPRVLALQWCWDAGFEPRVLILQWCFRASRLNTASMIYICLASKVWALHLTICLQWFLDSLQQPSNQLNYLRMRPWSLFQNTATLFSLDCVHGRSILFS